MSGAIKRLTPNFGFNIINYDFPRWHTYDWQNWDVIDAVLAAASLTSVKGVWKNSTSYLVGDRVVDNTNSTLWLCAVNHTSAASGTFLAARTANPTYWASISTVPIYRGAWITTTVYTTQDIVLINNAYYLCIAAHTSGVFATDLASGKWTLVFSLQAAIDAAASASASASSASTSAGTASTQAGIATTKAGEAATSASNAAGSASAASTSAGTATTQAGIATTKAGEALTSANNAATSATNAGTSATNAGTSETNANNSAIAAAASAASIVPTTLAPPGMIAMFERSTAPTGWLKSNGAVVNRTTYAALDAAIYCGDANNPTAEWGYRTNSTDTVRSTTGTHIKLRDWRGEFMRGWDDGRGVDTSRSLYFAQAQSFQAHTHTISDPGHTHFVNWVGGASGADINGGGGNYRVPIVADGAIGANPLLALTSLTGITALSNGTAETRPRNQASLVCIKF